MPIVASDLVFYAPLNSPLNDTDTLGGGIDVNSRIMTDILSAREKLEVVSDNSGDNIVVIIYGDSYAGEELVERIVLNGTTVVKGKVEFRKILEIRLASAAAGIVSIRKQSDSSVLQTIAAGITKYTTLFKNSFPIDGKAVTRYDKCFVKNNHASLALLDAAAILSIDLSDYLSVGVAASVDDTVSVANRKTAPSSITFSSEDTYINVPGLDLGFGKALGIWIKQTLQSDSSYITEASSRPQVAIAGEAE